MRGVDVVLQYFDDCPNWRVADDRLRAALRMLGRDDGAVRYVRVVTAEDAERIGFRGSPTILIDGRDPFGQPESPIGLACRVYRNGSVPSVERLVEALR